MSKSDLNRKEAVKKIDSIVEGLRVVCNLPSQPGHAVENLTDADGSTTWHTDYGVAGQARPEEGLFIELSFDLGAIYAIRKLEYEPREDAGNGTFLKVKYTTSVDGENWSEMSRNIIFSHDANSKEILLNGLKFRYMRVIAIETVAQFGSGIHFRFYKATVEGVRVVCNLPSQPGHEVENLTDADGSTIWHTDWGVAGQARPEEGLFIELSFDLKAVYAIEKVEYEPREDAGNGTFLKVKYTTSVDGENWNEMSKDIIFSHDANSKEILLNGLKFRYMKVIAIETVAQFGSGIHFRFYKADPFRNTVKGVRVACNLPSQPGQEVENLTDADGSTIWHTDWSVAGQARPEEGLFIELSFDLEAIYAIEKVEYEPREDAGNGTFLQVKYTTSVDGENWNEMSKDIIFSQDANSKEILLNGLKFRYMKVIAIETVAQFGSGIHFRFYKATVEGVGVVCNLPSQPGHAVEYLTDDDGSTTWHTDYGVAGQARPEEGLFIELSFDLGAVYAIKKVEYAPREDAGNGTLLQVKYTTSVDGEIWREMSNDIIFSHGANSKEILLNGLIFRYMRVVAIDTVAQFGSGIHFKFYKDFS